MSYRMWTYALYVYRYIVISILIFISVYSLYVSVYGLFVVLFGLLCSCTVYVYPCMTHLPRIAIII